MKIYLKHVKTFKIGLFFTLNCLDQYGLKTDQTSSRSLKTKWGRIKEGQFGVRSQRDFELISFFESL